MLSNDEFAELQREVASLRLKRVASNYGSIPASVEHLQTVLRSQLEETDRADVYSLLVNECSKAGNDRLYLDVLRQRVAALPNDPLSHAGLALRLALIEPAAREEALGIAYNALQLAKSQDRQVKYCATNLARVGLMVDDYAAIHNALVTLLDDAVNVRAEDSRYEFDFVAQIDAARFDAGLLARYKALA